MRIDSCIYTAISDLWEYSCGYVSARWLGGGLFCCFPICFSLLSLSTGDACHGRLVQNLGKMLTSFTAKHFISHINLKLRFVLPCHFMFFFQNLTLWFFCPHWLQKHVDYPSSSLMIFDALPPVLVAANELQMEWHHPLKTFQIEHHVFSGQLSGCLEIRMCEIWVLPVSGLQVVDVCRKFKVLSGGNFHVLHGNMDSNMACAL